MPDFKKSWTAYEGNLPALKGSILTLWRNARKAGDFKKALLCDAWLPIRFSQAAHCIYKNILDDTLACGYKLIWFLCFFPRAEYTLYFLTAGPATHGL